MIKLVSFDVFDTLLCRLVDRPTDVFKLMEEVYGQGFTRIRIEAEAASRKGREETTLADIYDCVAKAPGFDAKRAGEAMAAEIEMERRVCVTRSDIVSRLEDYRNRGIRVVAISDMYLPQTVVAELLAIRGIHVDATYVSSEYGLTKHTGRLFDLVGKLEGVKVSDWMHHGDNEHADVAIPLARGIEAIHTPIRASKIHSNAHYTSSIAGSIVRGVERAAAYSHLVDGTRDSIWFDIGARHTGPIATQICAEARSVADETGSSHIFFLARDGMVMKRVYDILYPDDTRTISYIAASRRMINFPLRCSDTPDYEFLGAVAGGLTVDQLLGRIGVTASTGGDVELKDDDHARLILKEYENSITAAARTERAHVEAYLEHVGLLDATDAVVVDVGWNCSIQKSLASFIERTGRKCRLHGVYIGTNIEASSDLDARGLYFSGAAPSDAARLVNTSVEVMELLFTSPESTIVTVVGENGEFRVVRSEFAEEATKQHAAGRIIEGAAVFARYVLDAGLVDAVVSPSARQVTLEDYRSLAITPSKIVATCAASINHSVGIAGSEQRPLASMGLNWRRPLGLFRGYHDSFWKGATRSHFGRVELLLTSSIARLVMKCAKMLPSSARRALKRVVR